MKGGAPKIDELTVAWALEAPQLPPNLDAARRRRRRQLEPADGESRHDRRLRRGRQPLARRGDDVALRSGRPPLRRLAARGV